MNGILWKWTNYYNGWQPRWFVLKDGILSYFRSEDEVNSGSKGSINLSVCDLHVNTYDSSRFEIIIPGEQKYFIKASNTQERQRWIVALGSCKACHIEPEFQIKEKVGDCHLPLKEINFKESELRVYLELMNQQVSSIKCQLSEDSVPDVSTLNELTSTLNAACDTFLESVKDLVSIAVTSYAISISDSPPTHIGTPIFSSLPIHSSTRSNRQLSRSSVSERQCTPNGHGPVDVCSSSLSNNKDRYGTQLSFCNTSRRDTNFIIEMPHSFVDWSHEVEATHFISTKNYIDSTMSLLHFLDFFEAQPIISLKLDIRTFVKKLSLKYESDTKKYCDLECIIFKDGHKDSPTIILRSIHRILSYVHCLLILIMGWLRKIVKKVTTELNEDMLKNIITEAFTATMEDKLNWLDRGQFTIIAQSLPLTSRFICHLISVDYCPHIHLLNNLPKDYDYAIDQLVLDLDKYCMSISTVNNKLTDLFIKAKIDL